MIEVRSGRAGEQVGSYHFLNILRAGTAPPAAGEVSITVDCAVARISCEALVLSHFTEGVRPTWNVGNLLSIVRAKEWQEIGIEYRSCTSIPHSFPR